MNYGMIKYGDDVNADGMSVSLFVSGCEFNCRNCFNKEAQDKNFGNIFDEKIESQIITYFNDNLDFLDNLCILGGDALMSYNYSAILSFVKKFKSIFPSIDIILWTGFTYDVVVKSRNEILQYIDVLCDGQFEQDKYKKGLKYVGSTNQRIINVKESLKQNKIVLLIEQ